MSAMIDTASHLADAALANRRTLPNVKPAADPRSMDQAAQQFEAVFLTQMLQPMFQGIKSDGLFGGGQGEEMFRSVLLDEYGKLMAERGGIGIAGAMKADLLKLQEV